MATGITTITPESTEVPAPSVWRSSELRFGVLVLQDADFSILRERWRRVEELAFDYLFVADHARDTQDRSHAWFDG